ncbi:HGxxPAAW family protein [Kineococcus sp. LSe6-4]|uniref:HGxxPAAW family protein n=1 Tax=Kineococcus halophytocola TaxID=3234027 RepID=A0ABV4GWE9_9ACTN
MSTEPSQQSRGESEVQHLADIVDEHGHGHSIAAWAGVGVCLVGFLILCLAVVFPSLTWGIVGGVVILGSLVVSAVLAKAGYGVKGPDGKPVGLGRPGR